VGEITTVDRRASRLKKCLRLTDEVLALVPTQQQMPLSVRQKEGYFFAEGGEKVSSCWKKDKTGKVSPETYELQCCTVPLNGVPINWKKITELRQNLAICLSQCGIEYPDTCNIREEKRGGQTLVHEKAWRCCMKGLRRWLEQELDSEEAPDAATGALGTIRAETMPVASGPVPTATPNKGSAPKATVNMIMLELMQSAGCESSIRWSVDEWRNQVETIRKSRPAKSTIHKQPTWKRLMKLRKENGVEMQEHQTVADQTGKRRSRTH
jgi:hypothetical protein